MNAATIKKELFALSDPQKKEFLPYFFKTGKGQYGEGDQFIGVVVPLQRQLVKKYNTLDFNEIALLLTDPYHECRLTGLLFLVQMFNKSKDLAFRKTIYDFYIAHVDYINNWDLVDLSARDIVGGYLWSQSKEALLEYAKSGHLWLQRISMIATYYFIKKNDFEYTFKVSDILITHSHDLIHKVTGWMLREVGNINHQALEDYLLYEKRYAKMPRTMLRYAIEKFEETERQAFLKGLK